ncbi:MAG: UDP-N-acetylmuramate dehydrogenase [Marmoricola sp.]|nr:UDP-N-acetylmuramate dehydrogenase [Marmoricola sp.]
MTELLADHTTLRLGGPAAEFVVASTEAELVDAVRSADEAGTSVLLLSGGSNLVVGDQGFGGRVVAVRTTGVRTGGEVCGGVEVVVAAGEPWDDFVGYAVEHELIGVEALAGIPGSVGSTPIQNVGAYGQEVSQTIASVRCWDRVEKQQRTFAAADCGFGYRTSRFKADPTRYVVLEVVFQFRQGDLGAPVEYAELARALGVEPGGRASSMAVRDAVLTLRASKGMVLDPADHDTWSAGSFFTNPVLDVTQLPEGAPSWPQPDGRVKTSAAWLIEHAGFAKGYGNERVSLSTKHTLALTNRGGASTADLLRLAYEIRDGVQLAFGITLVNEPTLVGCSL